MGDLPRLDETVELAVYRVVQEAVEDRGGDIQGKHIDVWCKTHAEAKRLGVKWLRVRMEK